LVVGMALVGVVAAVGLAIAASGQDGQPTDVSDGKTVGRLAPDFTITTFGGETLTLSQLRGKVVVLNFWASWCPPCRAETPALEAVWREYRDKGVVFVGVDIQDTEPEARAFLEQFDVTYANGPDTDGRIMVDYMITNIPTSVVVSRRGTIVQRYTGAIGRDKLVLLLDDALER